MGVAQPGPPAAASAAARRLPRTLLVVSTAIFLAIATVGYGFQWHMFSTKCVAVHAQHLIAQHASPPQGVVSEHEPSRRTTTWTVDQCVDAYRKSKSREPPLYFDRWCKFAINRWCEIDGYEQIDEDFAYWRTLSPAYRSMADPENGSGNETAPGASPRRPISKRVIHKARFPWRWTVTLSVKNGELLLERGKEPYSVNYMPFYEMIAKLLPDMTFTIDSTDYPLSTKKSNYTINYLQKLSTVGEAMKLVCDQGPGELNITNLEKKHTFFAAKPDSFFLIDEPVPFFSNSKLKGSCSHDIVVPEMRVAGVTHDTGRVELSAWKDKHHRLNSEHDFDSKKDDLYFRGTLDCNVFTNTTFHEHHRPRLLLMAKQWNRTDINVGLSTCWWAYHQEAVDAMISAVRPFWYDNKDHNSEMWKHKYLLDIDGGTGGYSGRTKFLLGINALIFRSAIFKQYFDGDVREWEHYVPINPDYSDIPEKLDWAKSHPDEVRRIIKNANDYITNRMRLDDELCYTYRALIEYHSLVDEYPGKWNDNYYDEKLYGPREKGRLFKAGKRVRSLRRQRARYY